MNLRDQSIALLRAMASKLEAEGEPDEFVGVVSPFGISGGIVVFPKTIAADTKAWGSVLRQLTVVPHLDVMSDLPAPQEKKTG